MGVITLWRLSTRLGLLVLSVGGGLSGLIRSSVRVQSLPLVPASAAVAGDLGQVFPGSWPEIKVHTDYKIVRRLHSREATEQNILQEDGGPHVWRYSRLQVLFGASFCRIHKRRELWC